MALTNARLGIAAGLATGILTAGAVSPANARMLCVGHVPGCASTLRAALAAARDGDTVRISRGTFDGGVAVRASVHLVGAGAGATVIRGGGPVLTIGMFGATREPTVSIDRLTITGGVTHASAQARKLVGNANALAFGGGIEVPPAAGFGLGATVRITDSVITRNRVSPSAAVHSGLPCGAACPFALAGGGGIDNWGRMTLTNVVVSGNLAGGPLASDADGAGIDSAQGSLTLHHVTISGNRASVSPPNGRFAEGGGIVATSTPFFLAPRHQVGRLAIEDSTIRSNAAELSERFPSGIEAHANGGGVLIAGDDDCTHATSGCVTAAIRHSSVSRNSVRTTNTGGDANGFSGGLGVDGSLLLIGSTVDQNRVTAAVPQSSSSAANGDSAGIGMGGYASISHSRLVGNSVSARASGGVASAMFGALSAGSDTHRTSVTHTDVSDNHLKATTVSGSFRLQGAGIGHLNGAPLIVTDTTVTHNRAAGTGPDGLAEGGGIWNGSLDPSTGLGPLRIIGTSITHNALTVPAAMPAQGGGLFTAATPILRHSVIVSNAPDQCHGC